MNFKVYVTSDAEKDILGIYNYVSINDSDLRKDFYDDEN